MNILTSEAAQQIEDALKLAIRTSYSEHNNIKFEAALASIRSAMAQDHHGWPHEATIKLRWAGYGPYPECIAWAKRGENGELVTAYSLLPLDETKWEVIDERIEPVELVKKDTESFLNGPSCNQHQDAPHSFDRNASHSAGRYVCECEGWTPEATK